MAVLINGNGFSPVTAQMDADLYGGIVGIPLTVLRVGQEMAATIIDANTVRIGDGEAVCQGRRIHNEAGQYDDFTIPNGSQGVTKYWIIGYHIYTDGSGNELIEPFVQEVASTTATIPEAVLRDGATETYISFYRVTQLGLSLTYCNPLYVKPQNMTSTPVVQTGAMSVPASANSYADYNVTFPELFMHAPLVVCGLRSTSTSPTMGSVSVAAIDVSNSGFTIRVFNASASNKSPVATWIAVGDSLV